jgi:hypothetical protein
MGVLRPKEIRLRQSPRAGTGQDIRSCTYLLSNRFLHSSIVNPKPEKSPNVVLTMSTPVQCCGSDLPHLRMTEEPISSERLCIDLVHDYILGSEYVQPGCGRLFASSSVPTHTWFRIRLGSDSTPTSSIVTAASTITQEGPSLCLICSSL